MTVWQNFDNKAEKNVNKWSQFIPPKLENGLNIFEQQQLVKRSSHLTEIVWTRCYDVVLLRPKIYWGGDLYPL